MRCPFSFSLLPMEGGGENKAWQPVPMLRCLQVGRDANTDQSAKAVPKGVCPASRGGCSSLRFLLCAPPGVTLLEMSQWAQRAEKKPNIRCIYRKGRGWLFFLKINGGRDIPL